MIEYYKNNHQKAGLALILCQTVFDDQKNNLPALENDAQKSKETWEKFGFQVEVHRNLNEDEILDKLKKAATGKKYDFDYNCLVVVALSHGDDEKNILTNDGLMEIEKLWTYFTGEKCKRFYGKPKLFFIGACRGTTPDFGTLQNEQLSINKMEGESLQNAEGSVQNISIMSDILVMFSSADGYESFYESANGSWFIEVLCKVLNEYLQADREIELITLLTCINRRISISKVVDDMGSKFYGRKQMPVIMSMLTKTYYFNRNQMIK